MIRIASRVRFFRVLCAFAAIASGLMTSSWASDLNGFLREKGHGDVALSLTGENYDHFWVGGTKVQDPGVGSVHTTSLSLWFAYGLTDRLTLTGDVPYIHAKNNGLGQFDERDLQDFTLLLEYLLGSAGTKVRSDFVGAVGARAVAVNYQANLPVDIGDGTDDWLFRFIYQLRVRNFYFSQQIGFDARGADAPDGVPLYTEVGQTWGPVTVSGFYSRLIANGGTDIGDPGFTFPSNGDEYSRVGARVYGRVSDHIGLSGAWYTTLTGRNTGDSNGVSGGVVFSF